MRIPLSSSLTTHTASRSSIPLLLLCVITAFTHAAEATSETSKDINNTAKAAHVPPAYKNVGQRHNVPPALLFAIALTESKHARYHQPWPWTANVKGRSFYFQSRELLYRHLTRELSSGNTHFDVGPMQINWRWHAYRFDDDLWNATNPYLNLEAGARYLKELHRRFGSYNRAVGAYHTGPSNTSAARGRAERYSRRVAQHLQSGIAKTESAGTSLTGIQTTRQEQLP